MSDAGKSLTSVQRGLVIGALAALLIGLCYWWYTTLEWEEKEIDLGYSKEAKLNDFLAAEIFLRKQGVQATTVKNLSLLDKHSWRNIKLGVQDTIVIINGYKTLTQERYDSLYEWVEKGGTLITSTQNPFIGAHTSEEDLLLKDFNIELAPEEEAEKDNRSPLEKLADGFDDEDADGEKSGEDEADDATDKKAVADNSDEKSAAKSDTKKTNSDDKEKAKEEEKPENYYRCALDEPPTAIFFGGEEKPLDFDFSHNSEFIYYDYIAHTDETANEDINSNETPSEEDDSTAGAEENTSINADESNTEATGTEEAADAEPDHQYEEKRQHLLYFDIGEGSITITSDNYIWANQRIDCHNHAYGLWRLINPKGRVWFLVNQDAPSLAAIVWSNARYGVLAALAALILWLWAQSLRFGPVLVVEQTGRRSLAEHIYASAMLLWRKQQHPQLLELLRKEILDRLDEQHPNLHQATQEQRAEFLQELTGINAADIQKALYSVALRHPQDFVAAIAHLQTIRKQLHGSNL